MFHNLKLPTVLVLNSSEDFLDLVQRFLNVEGFVVATLALKEVKHSKVNIVTFIQKHDPSIIIYDIDFPYKENWQQCERIRKLDVCRGREFILTVANLDALEDQVGKKVGAFQLVDIEIDLVKIIQLVKETSVKGLMPQVIHPYHAKSAI